MHSRGHISAPGHSHVVGWSAGALYPQGQPQQGWRAWRYYLVRGMDDTDTLTRPAGTLSHRMGEGRGEVSRVAHPADCSGFGLRLALRAQPRSTRGRFGWPATRGYTSAWALPNNVLSARPVFPHAPGVISVEHLDFAYPDGRVALRDVSFRIARGETAGLIGPNGAGKSTLLLHLNGLIGLPRRQGGIAVNGLVVDTSHLPEIRRRVGLLFQDPDDQLFSATVGEDVAFGPQQLGLAPEAVTRRVAQALAQVELAGFESRVPQHLSLGEKKRVCLAGVLACEPEVLVFDEPTANFDPRGRREFIALCRRLTATKLIASHDLEMIVAVCDRVLVLDEGRLVAQGPTRSVLGDEPLMLQHGLEKPHSLLHAHPHSYRQDGASR